jgi:collagen type III alpha
VQVTSQITLNNSLVVGGMGGTGAAGADEPPGGQGGAVNGRMGGTNPSCSNTDGGAGSNRMVVQWYSISDYPQIWCSPPGDQKFGDGCPPPYQYPWYRIQPCAGLSGLRGNTSGKDNGGSCGRPISDAQCPSSSGRGNDGGAGSVGVNATCGSGGTASSNTEGSFVGANWSPGAGGTGTTGLNAGGGGGGGPGGAFACPYILQPVAVPGAEGGGGGAGGNGGPSGAVALVGGAKVDATEIVYYGGSSGNFGGSGKGGISPVCPSGAPPGAPGVNGSVADVLTYP